MAHLLGSKNCLDSLFVDIMDVNETIEHIFGRVGIVRFPSWKYPDKISSDLDIRKLLERYSYSKDEEHCQLSHVILFELLIDRLVLFMQSLSSLCHRVVDTSSGSRQSSVTSVGSAMSVGLVVKKFWNKLSQLTCALKHELAQANSKDKKIVNLEDHVTKLKKDLKTARQKSENFSSCLLNGENQKNFVQTFANDNKSLFNNEDVKSYINIQTQTYDTAFIPCEACSRSQENLIAVGDMVIKLCENQGLPSNLAKQKRLLKQSLLAAADVSRWADEQNRDLTRINEHLDNLYGQINPLQEKLRKSRERRRTLEESMKNLEEKALKEKEEMKQLSDEMRKKLSVVCHEMEEMQEKSSQQIKELTKSKESLELRVKENEILLKQDLAKKEELESACARLRSDLAQEKAKTTQGLYLSMESKKLKENVKELENEHEKMKLELGKMEAKNRNLTLHDESLQRKHQSLLQRIDELDQDCEELRGKLMDIEGERDEIQDTLDEVRKKNEKLSKEFSKKQNELERITSEKSSLAQVVKNLQFQMKCLKDELQENEKKLKLIVQYPIDGSTVTSEDVSNPVVITREMEKQIVSNNIRISMLEVNNNKLRDLIKKLNEKVGKDDARKQKMSEPVPLWLSENDSSNKSKAKSSSLDRIQSDDVNDVFLNSGTKTSSEFIKSSDNFRPCPPSGIKPSSKESTCNNRVVDKRQTRVLSAKIFHSNKHKADLIRATSAGGLGSTIAKHDDNNGITYECMNKFICEGCDKMYTTRKDLDIHKAFCYELK